MTLAIPCLRIFLFLRCCWEILGRNMRKTSIRIRHFSGGLWYLKDPPEVRDPRSRELVRIGADLAHRRSFLWSPLTISTMPAPEGKDILWSQRNWGSNTRAISQRGRGRTQEFLSYMQPCVSCHVPSLVTQVLAWMVITICSQVMALTGAQVPRRALQHGLWNQQNTGMGPAGRFSWAVRNPSKA